MFSGDRSARQEYTDGRLATRDSHRSVDRHQTSTVRTRAMPSTLFSMLHSTPCTCTQAPSSPSSCGCCCDKQTVFGHLGDLALTPDEVQRVKALVNVGPARSTEADGITAAGYERHEYV